MMVERQGRGGTDERMLRREEEGVEGKKKMLKGMKGW